MRHFLMKLENLSPILSSEQSTMMFLLAAVCRVCSAQFVVRADDRLERTQIQKRGAAGTGIHMTLWNLQR